MNKIWFTSDLHFCHDREFIYGPRGFKSIHEMNDTIIKNFNDTVAWDDDLFILGDCFLNNNEEGMKLMLRLPGQKHIIWGNHDTDARQKMMICEFDCAGYASVLKYKGYHFYLSHYPTLTSNLDENKDLKHRMLNLFGHTHSKTKFYEGRPYMYNIALDAHNNFPVDLDTIIKDIQKEVNDCFKAV